MQTKTSSLLKGMGLGMIAGAAATVTVKTVLSNGKHNVSKGSAKIVNAVSEMVDGIQTMFK